MDKKMEIKRPGSPQDGPGDGVMGVAECIRTDFLENPAEGEAAFQQRPKSEAHLEDAMEVMKLAIDASKGAKRCQEMSDNAENAESE